MLTQLVSKLYIMATQTTTHTIKTPTPPQMASTRILSLPPFIVLSSLLISLTLTSPTLALTTSEDTHSFARTIDRKLMGLKKEKLSHFKFYWHDIVSGKNPTSIQVVNPASNSSTTGFGLMNIIDNPLTIGPDLSSKLVGRAQGLYASAQQEQIGFLMIQNFHFIEGKYNGSTITVVGRNQGLDKVREMPVVGGSGLFRFARGYVQARTQTVNLKTRDAIIEYNVYVSHY